MYGRRPITRRWGEDDALRANSDFAAMDFTTRDHYRHAIEQIARASGRTDLEVTEQAVRKASRALEAAHEAGVEPGGRDEDPGYFLVSSGRGAFERELGFRVSAKWRLLRAYGDATTPAYIGTIALLTGGILLPLMLDLAAWGLGPLAVLPFALLALFPASDLAIALVNRAVTAFLKPRVLPRLELRNGVPASLRMIVVVPTLLATRSEIEQQVDQLEVHYLANPDGDLYFALLSDWMDAPAESVPDDEGLVAAAVDATGRLNRRHGPAPGGGDRFTLPAPLPRPERA